MQHETCGSQATRPQVTLQGFDNKAERRIASFQAFMAGLVEAVLFWRLISRSAVRVHRRFGEQ